MENQSFQEVLKRPVPLNMLIEKMLHVYCFLTEKRGTNIFKKIGDNSLKRNFLKFSLKPAVLMSLVL